MKKFIMMAVVAMMATMSVSAQQMFIKPMVGVNLAQWTNIDHAKFNVGVVGGAEFGYYVSDPFAVTAGLLVSMQGTSQDDDQYIKDRKNTMTYINVPILANYYIIPGLAIKAGIQPGFLVSNKAVWSEHVGNNWVDRETTSTDGAKKFDLSIPLGLSYEFSNVVIDARYNLGLTSIADNSDCKNSVLMFTVGYKIPF